MPMLIKFSTIKFTIKDLVVFLLKYFFPIVIIVFLMNTRSFEVSKYFVLAISICVAQLFFFAAFDLFIYAFKDLFKKSSEKV